MEGLAQRKGAEPWFELTVLIHEQVAFLQQPIVFLGSQTGRT